MVAKLPRKVSVFQEKRLLNLGKKYRLFKKSGVFMLAL